MRLGAVVDKRNDRRPHVGVDREEQAVVLAAITEPLERRHGRKRILGEAAVFLGDEQALNAKTTTLFPGIVIENGVAVVFDHVVVELFFGEAIDRVEQLSLLVRPGKIHALRSPSGL